MKPIFITGIGTDVGKTIISSILVQKYSANYWKPIQCGLPRDTDTVKSLVDNERSVFFDEAFCLKTPLSPHAAAKLENTSIELVNINLPPMDDKILIIEGAGGLMVPLSKTSMNIDLIRHLGAKVILVSKFYLGSINHTLLSLQVLKGFNIPVAGIIWNGEYNLDSVDIIRQYFPVPSIGAIPIIGKWDKKSIAAAGALLNLDL